MAIVLLLVAIPMSFYSSFITGLAMWQLYQWFLIPLEFPNLSGWHLVGISLFIGLIRYRTPETKKDYNDSKTAAMTIIEMVIAPPILAISALCFGWVIAHFAGLF